MFDHFEGLERRLNHRIWELEVSMSQALDDLTAAVAGLTSSVHDAVAKIGDLAGQVSAANSDPAIEALAGQIKDQVATLKAAVEPATPVEPPVAAPVEPAPTAPSA
jgi:hypothetical protein